MSCYYVLAGYPPGALLILETLEVRPCIRMWALVFRLDGLNLSVVGGGGVFEFGEVSLGTLVSASVAVGCMAGLGMSTCDTGDDTV